MSGYPWRMICAEAWLSIRNAVTTFLGRRRLDQRTSGYPEIQMRFLLRWHEHEKQCRIVVPGIENLSGNKQFSLVLSS